MPSFSQRNNFVPIRQSLQTVSIDAPLKNSLWNVYVKYFQKKLETRINNWEKIEEYIWSDFFKRSITELDNLSFNNYVHHWFLIHCKWYEIYDYIEFSCSVFDDLSQYNLRDEYITESNRVLQREMSAYRIIDGLVTQITSEAEISSIEEATQNSVSMWQPVTKHLTTSLSLFSSRQNPDYRNSIKESISAIESACKIITKDENATLGAMLNTLGKKQQIPQSLKAAFSALYGYTSEEGGIRHALTDNARDVTFEEAKFMLVACSAFSNYLVSLMN